MFGLEGQSVSEKEAVEAGIWCLNSLLGYEGECWGREASLVAQR